MRDFPITIDLPGGGVMEATEQTAPARLAAGMYTARLDVDGVIMPCVIFTRPTYLSVSAHAPLCTTLDGVRDCTC